MAQGKRILLIEDDRDLVDALTAVLESHGHTVETAFNQETAWQKVGEARPDLAIIDVMLDTVGEGIHITQQFRKDEGLRGLPIIMLTSINQQFPLGIGPEEEEGYLPVDVFLEKPVDPDELLEHIEKLTGQGE
jgi:CheY-like chemotaxis protein